MLGPVSRSTPLECSAHPPTPPPPPTQVYAARTLPHNPQAGQALPNTQVVQALTKWIIGVPSQTLHFRIKTLISSLYVENIAIAISYQLSTQSLINRHFVFKNGGILQFGSGAPTVAWVQDRAGLLLGGYCHCHWPPSPNNSTYTRTRTQNHHI